MASIRLEDREVGQGGFVYVVVVRFGRPGYGMPAWRSSGRATAGLGYVAT